ncbi:MAG: hypothetical protein H7838_02350 [Magnetococcus sp. DMHC-8]
MTDSVILLDPLTWITDLRFPGWSWQWCLRRDDGLRYTPAGEEALTLHLYGAGGSIWLLTAQTIANPTTATLPCQEARSGLVTAFAYREGCYHLTLNRDVLHTMPGNPEANGGFRLVTEGVRTLKTVFPRGYLAGDAGLPIPPGVWEVQVPFWSVTTATRYPDLVTTDQLTTVAASIPWRAAYRIRPTNAYGYFLLPVLGVTWRPDPTLSGWVGFLQVEDVCGQGGTVIPGQSPAGLLPPDWSPTDPGQQVFRLYHDIRLMMALSPCPGQWSGTAIACSTNFGHQATIPFCWPGTPDFHAEWPLEAQAANRQGQEFIRRYQWHWDRRAFAYATGEGETRAMRWTATLVQSPVTAFEQFLVEPLAERRG